MEHQLRSWICLFLLIGNFGCNDKTESSRQVEKKQSSFLVGQWYTDDNRYPHWVMFDSTSNYYRWSFDEEIPTTPTAQYTIDDSLIYFEYPDFPRLSLPQSDIASINIPSLIDSINPYSFRILPIEGESPVFIYERDTFNGPQYVDLYFFYLNKQEVESLDVASNNSVRKQYKEAFKNLKDIHIALEYSLANITVNDTRFITLRDSGRYDKFDYGGFGVIFHRNDSTYVHIGIPTKEDFFKRADDFFPISINTF